MSTNCEPCSEVVCLDNVIKTSVTVASAFIGSMTYGKLGVWMCVLLLAVDEAGG